MQCQQAINTEKDDRGYYLIDSVSCNASTQNTSCCVIHSTSDSSHDSSYCVAANISEEGPTTLALSADVDNDGYLPIIGDIVNKVGVSATVDSDINNFFQVNRPTNFESEMADTNINGHLQLVTNSVQVQLELCDTDSDGYNILPDHNSINLLPDGNSSNLTLGRPTGLESISASAFDDRQPISFDASQPNGNTSRNHCIVIQ